MAELTPEIERAVQLLGDRSRAQPASGFPAGHADVDMPGLYTWWVDEDGRELIASVFDTELPEMIYGGQAGATSSRSGVVRVATLRSRIAGNHLRGNISSSTFRRTLTAVLFEPLGLRMEQPGKLARDSNDAISNWIRTHLRIATVGCPDRSALAALEHAVLGHLDPPLNLMGMSPTPIRGRLRELRRRLGAAE